jgi:phospholipid transport system substrate-binding protein
MKSIKGLFYTLFLVFPAILFAQDSPLPMLQQSAQQIISTLKENKVSLQNNPKVIQDAVQRYLLPNVDVSGMSRSVIGRQAWNAASASERAEFSKAFTQLVIRTYSTPLSKYTDETIKFLPQRSKSEGRFARVDSLIIRSNGQNIPLSYSLINKNGEWKVYDLSVEGVSLLQSFHNQFGQILKNASMGELIQQMNQKKKAA